MSLRVRLTLFYTLFLAIVLGLVATAVYAFTQRSLTRSLEENAREIFERIEALEYAEQGVKTLPQNAYFLIRSYGTKPLFWEDLKQGFTVQPDQPPIAKPPISSSNLSFLNQQGIVINQTNYVHQNPSREDLFNHLSDEDLKTLFDIKQTNSRIRFDSTDLIAYVKSGSFGIESSETEIRVPAVFMVALPFPIDTLTGLRSLLLRTALIAFIVFAAGVWLLSSRVLQPVKRVTKAAMLVSGRDLSQRVPVPKTKDEMHALAESLNHMLDRLQESFDTQRRFTADASHELRTPVTAIVGHANYLLRRTKPTEEQKDSLTVIRREAERMAKLVNDLLELARADAGFSISREPMNLVDVVEAVHMEVAPMAGSADITVSAPEPLAEVLGDASRLKQVVLNLVQNALNAGATQVTISVQNEKKQVRLEVLDNGPGIPQEAIPHLFDRFYRVDGARSTRGNGSGLGLAIVKWIVSQHEGTVQVESRVGEGTVFTVMLPSLNPKATETNILMQTFVGARAHSKPSSIG
ncbi:MAG: HAMP domain-containing histidine kinase [Trueperaceae bacterium]|nr:HAMP domain-containing histidine kinase [Trueperaceae bacterium]